MDKIAREKIKNAIKLKLKDIKSQGFIQTWDKEDSSIVTEMDIYISNLVRDEIKKISSYQNYCFYSEEENDDLSFPAVVLDPIDGTIEFERGSHECALSLALLDKPELSSKTNFAWVYNFNTGEEIFSDQNLVDSKDFNREKLEGLVSNTEWKAGLFKEFNHLKIQLKPVGSIANKLMLLRLNQSDFVASLKPKRVWDIAGGTQLLSDDGYQFYSEGKEVTSLEALLYEPPLIWCKKEHFQLLNPLFQI